MSMASKIEDLEKKILLLPISDLAILAKKKILLSLDTQTEDDFNGDNNEREDIEKAWIHEAHRRSHDFHKNPSSGRTADDVLSELDAQFH